MMWWDKYLHVLQFLHFTDNRNEAGRTEKNNYCRLCKLQVVLEILNETFSKFYSPSESLEINEVFVLLKGRVIFSQYISKEHKCSGIKIYKLCHSTSYTYHTKVYLVKDRQRPAKHFTVTQAMVTKLTKKIEGRGQKLQMANIFLPRNFRWLDKEKY